MVIRFHVSVESVEDYYSGFGLLSIPGCLSHENRLDIALNKNGNWIQDISCNSDNNSQM